MMITRHIDQNKGKSVSSRANQAKLSILHSTDRHKMLIDKVHTIHPFVDTNSCQK
jgi:hypothetical protein